jgi:hypothetical protein
MTLNLQVASLDSATAGGTRGPVMAFYRPQLKSVTVHPDVLSGGASRRVVAVSFLLGRKLRPG